MRSDNHAHAAGQTLLYIHYGSPKESSPYNNYINFEALLYDNLGHLVSARSEKHIGD